MESCSGVLVIDATRYLRVTSWLTCFFSPLSGEKQTIWARRDRCAGFFGGCWSKRFYRDCARVVTEEHVGEILLID